VLGGQPCRDGIQRLYRLAVVETDAGENAHALRLDEDLAFDYYQRINPSAREEISDVHRCEPYVYPQMIAGRDAPTFGEAKNSWLSGTAAWTFVAASQWILGIRAEYDGLRIDPCLPKEWERFEAVRKFRGATYQIRVSKPKGVCKDIAQVVVDGKKIEGNLIAPQPAGSEVVVEVTMG
ncbi:MAG: glycosyl hydrolase family 65 protein, partial [Gaiellaceae bacterium]